MIEFAFCMTVTDVGCQQHFYPLGFFNLIARYIQQNRSVQVYSTIRLSPTGDYYSSTSTNGI